MTFSYLPIKLIASDIISTMFNKHTTQTNQIVRKTSDFKLENTATRNVDIEPASKLKKSYGPDKPYWLYALKLEDGKYYVGFTARYNPYDRIMQHVEGLGEGARWTELHKPVEVIEVRDIGVTQIERAKALERNLTWEYMKIYGANNVRGGIINYTGKIVRIGNRFMFGYMVRAMLIELAALLMALYIVARHFYNWW